MSALLDDIIRLAVDGEHSLPDLLRKCLLLAHELKNERLKEWANRELNGYKSGKDDIPEYRVVNGHASGDFFGPFNSRFPSHIIPPMALEEQHRERARTVRLDQSVSAYASLVASAELSKGRLVFSWPADMVVHYQEKLLNGYICHSAWQEVPLNALVELLDTIRNRTLNMALEIKDELGTSYADLRQANVSESDAKIQSIIFQNTGGNTNVSFDQSRLNVTDQIQQVLTAGDTKALDRLLTTAGLEQSDVHTLIEAMKIDGTQPRNKVGDWIRNNGPKVLAGGVKIGSKIGSEILAAWIKQYYGLT
jgi:hypothetical protein